MFARGKQKRADYVLYYKPNIPIAIIEAKDNTHSLRSGIQQALGYRALLEDVPCVFSSNGDAFFEHDFTSSHGRIEREIPLDEFPSPEQLWERHKKLNNIEEEQTPVSGQDYFYDSSGREPRYYQQVAINRIVNLWQKVKKEYCSYWQPEQGKLMSCFRRFTGFGKAK